MGKHPFRLYIMGTRYLVPKKVKKLRPPFGKNMDFSPSLNFQYLNEFLSSDKGQGMENILSFSKFSKFSFAGLGALWVRQALFSKIFGKFEKFKTFIVP